MRVSRFKKAIWVLSLLLLLISNAHTTAIAADLRYIDVAQITWTGAKVPSVTNSQVASAITNEVAPNWKNSTSILGDTGDRSITVSVTNVLRNV
jgi:hypothetical protein